MANHRPVSLLPQSRAPIISIQIIFPEDAGNRDELPPVRQGGAELAGCLKVTLQSAIDFEIDIVFEGHVRTWMPDNDSDPYRTLVRSVGQIKLLEQAQTLSSAAGEGYTNQDSTSADGSVGHGGDENGLYRVYLPFRFVVPHRYISRHGDIADEFLNLCPSVKLGRSYRAPQEGTRYGQPNIEYAIRIRQIRAAALPDLQHFWESHGRVEREILVDPASQPAPPIEVTHFPNDYNVRAAVKLRRLFRRKAFGVLSVSAVEPAPMISCPAADSAQGEAARWQPGTVAHLELLFTPHGPAAAKPPTWTLAVTYAVRSRTFFSTCPMERSPTRQTAKDKVASMGSADRKGRPETREYRLDGLHWTAAAASGAATCCWKATLPLCVQAPQPPLVPTFLNLLSARQYALAVRLEVREVSHRVVELVLPLQVVRCSSPSPGRLEAEEGGEACHASDTTVRGYEAFITDAVSGLSSALDNTNGSMDGCELGSRPALVPPAYEECVDCGVI